MKNFNSMNYIGLLNNDKTIRAYGKDFKRFENISLLDVIKDLKCSDEVIVGYNESTADFNALLGIRTYNEDELSFIWKNSESEIYTEYLSGCKSINISKLLESSPKNLQFFIVDNPIEIN